MNFLDCAPLRWLFIVLGFLVLPAGTARGDDVRTLAVIDASVADVREAVIEAIESAGLVVSATIPFNRMLERTGKALEYSSVPYVDAETVQFCSARLAWQLVTEDPGQLALCPMSISIYATTAEPKLVRLAYRSLGEGTLGRQRGEQLLRELVERAAVLAGWRRR
ncbi:hypothetical protein [Sphingobium sp. EP60837]|uniref:hypothetical protein n=1 Tax=Sphingobium sp. EP60837 TaxID=1855519 RepID=UPI0007DCE29B|nr:hypothetical protein [Sphingobium sp. EP60837]ANI80331.1 hypothetical protein EP837_03953 [Sphingobium sp. EP60837]